MPTIQIRKGGVSDGDAQELHLVQNHLLDPEQGIDKFIMYAEKRYLATFLVSGARDSRYTAPAYIPDKKGGLQTKIKPIPNNKMVDQNGYSYKIMGRIQKSCEVLGIAGTPTAASSSKGSEFKLYIADDYLKKGMNVHFPNGKMARVKVLPQYIAPRKYLYTFEGHAGETFSYAAWFTGITGKKTIFGGYSSYGERSRRGYSNFHYPDKYIQHTTKQRKSFSLSGDVNANDVIWYTAGDVRGFSYEAEVQMRTQFLLEDEDQKWHGQSSMRDAYGNLLDAPTRYDDDGEPIVEGDGIVKQVEGINDFEFSGVGGVPVYEDYSDTVTQLRKHMDMTGGEPIICVVGGQGMDYARQIAETRATQLGMRFNVDMNKEVGGKDVPVGFNFQWLNIAGESILFVENPQWNDTEKYPAQLSNGLYRQQMMHIFGKWGDVFGQGEGNVEIMTRGRKGVNRNMVYAWFNGMTGENNKPDNPIDAKSFHVLKENLIVVRNTKLFSIGRAPENA